MTFRVRYLLPAAIGVAIACAHASGGSTSTSNTDFTRITREQLDELHQLGVRNLYEAIDRIRPRWLIVRSGVRSLSQPTQVVVFQDDAYLGGIDALERMGLEGVFQIRYIDGPTAQATLLGIGGIHVQGAIVVYMRPPPGGSDR